MTDEDAVVWSAGHRTVTYHLNDSCDWCPDTATTMRKAIAESWDTLDLCRHCARVAQTRLSVSGPDNDTADDTVILSEWNDLYHIPDRCVHQSTTNTDTVDRATAEDRGYRLCKFCDPGEHATAAANPPKSDTASVKPFNENPGVSAND
jgi:hypothetical protein